MAIALGLVATLHVLNPLSRNGSTNFNFFPLHFLSSRGRRLMFKTKLIFLTKEILRSMLKQRFGAIGAEEGNFCSFFFGQHRTA